MVAKGVDAIVVFPDAGEAMLPALRSAYKAGVVTVPTGSTPAARPARTTTCSSAATSSNAGVIWGELDQGEPARRRQRPVPERPARATARASTRPRACTSVLDPTGKYTFIGEQPFEVTNWDPAETQQVLTAAIAKNPKIDVIVSDFGPSLVGALPVFEQSGRSIPAIATSDGNVLACFWEDNKADNPDFKLFTVSTQNDHVPPGDPVGRRPGDRRRDAGGRRLPVDVPSRTRSPASRTR